VIEIERKFLVKNETYKSEAIKAQTLTQGYLSTDPKRAVRIRICNKEAYINVKGETSKSGVSRFEWEKKIDIEEAQNLILLCHKSIITKVRYHVRYGNHTFEVDEFLGDNAGLVVAEIELTDELESFERPNWLGKEVTGIKKYYNSQLSQNAFKNW
jgi:CYTH domain-containing protein